MLYIRHNGQRAREVNIIFIVVLIFSVINILSLAWQYILLLEVQDHPESIDLEKLSNSDTIRQIIAICVLILHVINIVYFIRWLRRAYYNVHQVPGASVTFTDGWAAGSWFIPILNLFRPFQIVRETWYETQRAIPHRIDRIEPNTLVGVWWAAYLVMSIYDNFTFRYRLRADDLDSLLTSTRLDIAGEVLSVIAAVLAIVLVKKMKVFEDELWDAAQNPDESVFSLHTEQSGEQPEY